MKLFISCFIAFIDENYLSLFFLYSNFKYVFRVFLKFNSDKYVFPLLYIKVLYISLTFINERYLSIFFIYQSQVFLPCYFLDLSITYISSVFFHISMTSIYIYGVFFYVYH